MKNTTIELKPAEPADFDVFYKWKLDEDMPLFTCRETYPPSRFSYESYFRDELRNKNRRLYKVVRIKKPVPLGKIAVFNSNPRNQSCEIGYYFDNKYRGKGYGFKAISLLLNYLFDQMNYNKVYAQTGSYNKASVALLEKLGFTREGVLREHHFINGKAYDDYIFGLFREEWDNIRNGEYV
ncbi:MAG: GNAT family N-acetyltransferase [candidate division Zixibacteria bacterium]|nr:GNAT family N-acetyltransferase [candidate division Zixibacteria bacterium]